MAMHIETDPDRTLVETGLLFKINREVLHPFGLAIVVEQEDDGTSRLKGVWSVEDPDGITFGPESLDDGERKLEAFMAREGRARAAVRQRALGYVVQPPTPLAPAQSGSELEPGPITVPSPVSTPTARPTLRVGLALRRLRTNPLPLLVAVLLVLGVLTAILARVR